MTLYVPLITPFERDGSVALAALRSLAHDVLDGGATGLVALGTTGEPAALTPGERSAVLSVLAAVSRDRSAPLIVGANDRSALADLDGVATAALTLVPPFLRPGEEGVLAHLAALAAASPVPLIVYHVPYRTAQPLSVTALRRLAEIDGVIGLKLAVGGIDTTTVEFLADPPPPDFAVLCGDDPFLAPLLSMGAAGGITASAHLATADFAALVAGTEPPGGAGRLARLSLALFAEPNPSVIKAVLHAGGRIPTPDVRLPLLNASPGAYRLASCLNVFN